MRRIAALVLAGFSMTAAYGRLPTIGPGRLRMMRPGGIDSARSRTCTMWESTVRPQLATP